MNNFFIEKSLFSSTDGTVYKVWNVYTVSGDNLQSIKNTTLIPTLSWLLTKGIIDDVDTEVTRAKHKVADMFDID